MTPFEVDILLHYATSTGDYRQGNFSAPILLPTLDGFVECGLLQRFDGGSAKYGPTDATYVYVDAICSVPAPVQQWVIPSPGAREP